MSVPAKPSVFFTWDIDYHCTYGCTYCFLRHETETTNIKARALTGQTLFEIWKGLFERYGKAHISVTGGEPFDYPGFMDLITRLCEFDTFEFSTNLSWDVAAFAARIKSDAARINPSFHPEHVEAEAFLEKYLFLRDQGYGVGCITVVGYPPLLEEIGRHKRIFEAKGVNVIVFPYRGPYQGQTYPAAYSDAERQALRQLGAGLAEEVNQRLAEAHALENKPKERLQDRLCGMGTKYAKIVPNGDAFRCCAAVWTPEKTWSNWGALGNIYDGTFSLSPQAQPCATRGECRCYKAMIPGREDDWQKHWIVPGT